MVHLRIVSPPDTTEKLLGLLESSHAVVNIVHLPGSARKPDGDVVLCDVAPEEVSVLLGDLKELDLHRTGSIALEHVDTSLSEVAEKAVEEARGLPADAVVWEQVEAMTSESTELSASFLVFMVVATLIAAIAVMVDSPILLVGAMIVGPEFGPVVGVCIAVVQRRANLVRRSVVALAVGFPLAMVVTVLATLGLRAVGIAPDDFASERRLDTGFIASPDWFSFIVAYLAGIVGVLSLTTAKSGALIGVLVSITTIPSAGDAAVAAAYGDGPELRGALAQLGINLGALMLSGIATLYVQRRWYVSRRVRHLSDPSREAAGLPVGRSRRG